MSESQDKVGQRNAWDRVAGAYADLWAVRLADYTAAGLDLLELDGSRAALDIACGPGHSTAALAERLEGGRALGVDFAPEMIERARGLWAGRPDLDFAVDDGERLSLPDAAYDVVTSSFGLMYFYETGAALAHMARVLRPGARLMAVVWGHARRVWWSPVIEMIETRAEYFSGVCPMIFFFGLPGVLARMLQDVGLVVDRQEILTEPMRFASIEQAVEAATVGAPLQGLFVHRLTEEARGEVRGALADHLEGMSEPDGGGVAVTTEVAVVIAHKPGNA